MKILYADADHVSQINFINALKGENDWSAKYAMAAPAIGNALNNEHFDVVICGVEFVSEVLNVAKDQTEIIALGDLENYSEIENLLDSGVNHFMKHPFCPANFQKIISGVRKDTVVCDNDALPDFDYLDKLTKGRTALKLDLMEIFVTVVNEEIVNVNNAIPENDLDAIGKSAHRMKSNVRMMGLRTLMELLDAIEDQSKGTPPIEFIDTVKDCCEMLYQSINLVKVEIEKNKSVEAK